MIAEHVPRETPKKTDTQCLIFIMFLIIIISVIGIGLSFGLSYMNAYKAECTVRKSVVQKITNFEYDGYEIFWGVTYIRDTSKPYLISGVGEYTVIHNPKKKIYNDLEMAYHDLNMYKTNNTYSCWCYYLNNVSSTRLIDKADQIYWSLYDLNYGGTIIGIIFSCVLFLTIITCIILNLKIFCESESESESV